MLIKKKKIIIKKYINYFNKIIQIYKFKLNLKINVNKFV